MPSSREDRQVEGALNPFVVAEHLRTSSALVNEKWDALYAAIDAYRDRCVREALERAAGIVDCQWCAMDWPLRKDGYHANPGPMPYPMPLCCRAAIRLSSPRQRRRKDEPE